MTRRISSLVIGLALFGCGSEREPTPEPTIEPALRAEQETKVATPVATPSDPPSEAPPSEAPPAPQFDPSLGDRFTLAHDSIPARDRGPSWQAADCELEYEFQIEVGSDRSAATVIKGGWTAHAAAPGMIPEQRKAGRSDALRRAKWILKNNAIYVGQQGRMGDPVRAGSLAEIRLQTDGRLWTEVDGPTTLWSAYGSWVGLSKFFPALPEGGALGSSVDWQLLVHEPGSGGRVEAQRGSLEVPEGVSPPEPKSTMWTARVTLERWIELDGSAAAVLRSWSEREGGDPQVHAISQAQFVVLDSGVLLHAELREWAKFVLGALAYEVTIEGEARLVRGCGGPVLPRLGDEARHASGDR